MASRIQILPDEVKHKIAAGEVVEGPFSVIKELVENSLDAGATHIDIEIEEAGLKKILVRDDGEGISREDMPFVGQEHATSKIRKIEDISSIATYGFRGEALSSIASISELSIISRRRDEALGSKLISKWGRCEITDYAGLPGCTVIAENLFFNVPARKKFLRSLSHELRSIKDIFFKTAIAHPDISFRLMFDGKSQSVLPAVKSARERIFQIYGDAVAQHLIEGELKDLRASISGFISGSAFHRPNRSLQQLYVNGRQVEYKQLGFLLSKSYESMLRHGEHPAAFLFIRIDPLLLDVNVHPSKKEVRFFDQNYINSLIINLARKILGSGAHRIQENFFIGKKTNYTPQNAHDYRPEDNRTTGEIIFQEAYRITIEQPSLQHSLIGEEQSSYAQESAVEWKVDVLFDTYLVVRDDKGLAIIDYHAAHERIIYDALMDKTNESESQVLLFPHPLELSSIECERILEKKHLLNEIGFDIEEIGKCAIAVRAIPSLASSLKIDHFFQDLAVVDERKVSVEELKKIISEKIACHTALRSGDSISAHDARNIAAQALSGKHETRCPHGRPFLYRLGKNEMDRLFKRT